MSARPPSSRPSENRPGESRNVPPFGFGPRGGPGGMFAEVQKSRDARTTLLRLWRYIARQRFVLIISTLLVIVTTIVNLLGPFFMGKAFDNLISKGNLQGLVGLLGLMALTYIVGAAGTWLQTYLMAGLAQRSVRYIRTDLFARLQSLPVKYFDQHAHGDLMSRLTNDVENIANILAGSFSQRQIVLGYYAFCAACGVLALGVGSRPFKLIALFVLAAGVLSLLVWASKQPMGKYRNGRHGGVYDREDG
jgi:ATP-binding cassette subfamily B multidrug efflux pump